VEIRWLLGLAECACETLEDWLDRVRRREPLREGAPHAGACARWEFFPMAIREKGRIGRPDRLVGLWVRHLAGCAHGLDLTSYLVAPDGMVRLAPLERRSAGDRLTAIIHHWWEGLQQPLPVTARTALAYLNAVAAADRGEGLQAIQARGAAAARKAYQGDGEHSLGELGHNGHLRRRYPDFDLLWATRGDLFRRLAETLYAPLRDALAEGG
jgi:exodeoxyribonuclease V gamma subunit